MLVFGEDTRGEIGASILHDSLTDIFSGEFKRSASTLMLRNASFSNVLAFGRLDGSLWKHCDIKSFRLSSSMVGGSSGGF